MALQYFIMQEWKFVNEETRALQEHLCAEDLQAFGYGETQIHPYEFFKNAALGGRKFLLKEGADVEHSMANNRRFVPRVYCWLPVDAPFAGCTHSR